MQSVGGELNRKEVLSFLFSPGGGGGNCHIWAIYVCAAVKGMVFKPFTLG